MPVRGPRPCNGPQPGRCSFHGSRRVPLGRGVTAPVLGEQSSLPVPGEQPGQPVTLLVVAGVGMSAAGPAVVGMMSCPCLE